MNIPRVPILFKLLKVHNEAQAFTVWLAILIVFAIILGAVTAKLTCR
jgi:hypothetical protein